MPDEIVFRTKPQIALDQLRAARAAGVEAYMVLTDAGYGNDTDFRDGIAEIGLAYAARPRSPEAVASSTFMWTSGAEEAGMWSHRLTKPFPGDVEHYVVLSDGGPIDCAAALEKLACDGSFRSYFREIVANSSFGAFRWEVPLLRLDSLKRQFEFVLVEDDGLLRPQDHSDFDEYFDPAFPLDEPVAFPSLGRDCQLVVPRPTFPDRDFSSLARFARTATDAQNDGLWKRVAEEVKALLPNRPVWLSTAGDAVPWLHVRLDTRPKYFSYGPYRFDSEPGQTARE